MSHLPTLGGLTGPPIPFPSATLTHLQVGNGDDEQSTLTRGKITTGSDPDMITPPIAIIYKNSNLEVLCPRSGERLAAYSFTSDNDVKIRKCDEFGLIETRTTEITCVSEIGVNVSRPYITSGQHFDDNYSFSSTSTSNRLQNRRLVAVGLSTGLLCIFDVKSSRIIRAIRVPNRITSVSILSNGSVSWSEDEDGCGGSTQITSRNFPEELLFFHGIIAVGTQGGHVYLIDACLDMLDIEETEKNPSNLHFLPSSDLKNLAVLRSVLHSRGERLCFFINLNAFKKANDIFSYFNTITDEEVIFPINSVIVSCLHFVPQMAALLVGFNFGAWQIWSTSRLIMEYGSLFDERSPNNGKYFPPVVEFAFTEPENDPSNHCYIWVVGGDKDFDTLEEKSESVNKLSTISLFSLSYNNRDDGGDLYGTLYSGLRACNLRFESFLPAEPNLDPELKVNGSTCIACYNLGSSQNGNLQVVSNVSDESCQDQMLSKMGLTVFLWEVQLIDRHDSTQKSWRYYIGLFDLNGWYLAQMPSDVTLASSRQCAFFNFCCLDEIVSSENQLVYVLVDGSTLSRFYQSPGLFGASFAQAPGSIQDQYFYPSSLSFEMICLLDKTFLHSNHLGLQRKVLLELQNQGRSGIVDPNDLYQLCLIAGLTESPAGTTEYVGSQSDQLPVEEKRSALLTVALDNNLINLLTGCVKHWSDGKYSSAGCTLEFLLNWAWQSVCNLKQAADLSMVPLFDNSDSVSSDSIGRILRHKSQQMHHLSTIIVTALEVVSSMRDHPFGSFTTLDDQLKLKLHLTLLITNYLDVVLWFLNSEFLPDLAEAESSLYPSVHMRHVYSKKRERMNEQLHAWEASNCMSELNSRETSFMLIDTLCKEFGDQFRINLEREGGNGLYPSPTLHAFLITYLIHKEGNENDTSADLIHKHRLIQYLFLDLASCMSNEGVEESNSTIVNSLIKFPSAFGIPPSIIKLTQAFWLVDHEDFDEAINMLLDPLISGNHITDSQHRSIILAFLAQDKPKFALQYVQIRQPPQKDLTDIQLHIAVLLANGLVHESFQFLRRQSTTEGHNNPAHVQVLLYYFFNRCDHLGKLDSILQLPLTSKEEKILVDFLLNSDDQRICRKEMLIIYYLQRSRYSEAVTLNEKLDGQSSGSTARKAIMQRYEHILPSFRQGTLGSVQSRWTGLSNIHPSQPVSIHMGTLQRPHGATPTFHSTKHFRVLSSDSPIGFHSNEFTPFRPKNKRRLNEVEEDPEVSESLQSHSKRSKLDFSSQIMTPSTLRLTSFTNQSILSVLDTPIIKRVKKTPDNRSSLNVSSTPHSILKMQRRMVDNVASNRCSETRRFLEEVETSKETHDESRSSILKTPRTLSTFSRESTPSKSLRFTLPSMEKPLSESENEETPEADTNDVTASSTARRTPSISTLGERPSVSAHKILTTFIESDDEIDLVENDSVMSESQYQTFETSNITNSSVADASFITPLAVTLPVDMTLIQRMAESDNLGSEKESSPSSFEDKVSDVTESPGMDTSLITRKPSKNLTDVSMCLLSTTAQIDMSLVRKLAHEDSDGDSDTPIEKTEDTLIVNEKSFETDVSLLAGDRTDLVDESLVRKIVSQETPLLSKSQSKTPKKSYFGITPLRNLEPVNQASMLKSNETTILDESLEKKSALILAIKETESVSSVVESTLKKRKRFLENTSITLKVEDKIDPIEQMITGKEKRFRKSTTLALEQNNTEKSSLAEDPRQGDLFTQAMDGDDSKEPSTSIVGSEFSNKVSSSTDSPNNTVTDTPSIEISIRRSSRKQKSSSLDMPMNAQSQAAEKNTSPSRSVLTGGLIPNQPKETDQKQKACGTLDRTKKDDLGSANEKSITEITTPSRALRSHVAQTPILETITEVAGIELRSTRRSQRASRGAASVSSSLPTRTRSSQSASSAEETKPDKLSRSRSTSFAAVTHSPGELQESPKRTLPSRVKSPPKKHIETESNRLRAISLEQRSSETKDTVETPQSVSISQKGTPSRSLRSVVSMAEEVGTVENSEPRTPRSSRKKKELLSSSSLQVECVQVTTPTRLRKKQDNVSKKSPDVESSESPRITGKGHLRQEVHEKIDESHHTTFQTLEKASPKSTAKKAEKQISSGTSPFLTPSRSLRSQTIQVPKLETISESAIAVTPTSRKSLRSNATKVAESIPSRRTRSSQSASSFEEVKVAKTPRSRSTSSAIAFEPTPASSPPFAKNLSKMDEELNISTIGASVADEALPSREEIPGPSRTRSSRYVANKFRINDPFPPAVAKEEMDPGDGSPKGPTKKKKYFVNKVVKYRKI